MVTLLGINFSFNMVQVEIYTSKPVWLELTEGHKEWMCAPLIIPLCIFSPHISWEVVKSEQKEVVPDATERDEEL